MRPEVDDATRPGRSRSLTRAPRALPALLAVAVAAAPGLRAQPPDGCPAMPEAVTPAQVLVELGIPADTTGVMLFRFESAAGRGYLFGTVHLGPPFITRGPPQALLALRDSDVFASEVIMDAPAQAHFAERARVDDGAQAPISPASLGPALFQRYLDLAARRGIPPALARRLTPWAAILSIGRPPIPPGTSLDETLQRSAERMGRQVAGLQSLGELMDALEATPHADQMAVLADTICQQRALGAYYRHLLEVYATGVPEAVVAFSRAGREDDPVLRRLEARLVTARNPLFVERIQALLARGRVFVALGAQHLPGPRGVLRGLESAGFAVQAVR